MSHTDIVFLHGNHDPRCIATVDKRFDYYTLQFMTRGGVRLWYDDEFHDMRGASTWTCGPGPYVRFHEWPRGTPWEHRYIAFTGPAARAWESAGLLAKRPLPVPSGRVRSLAKAFDAMLSYTRRADRFGRLRARNLLEEILLDLAEFASPIHAIHTSPPDWLRDVFNLLRDKMIDDYGQIAERVGMSESTLRRKFREATGTPIHQHAIHARLARAKRLLEQPDLSIKQIAAQTGYRDVYYFGRHFTKVFGVPPGRYRKSVQR